jgi:hypothetical protein
MGFAPSSESILRRPFVALVAPSELDLDELWRVLPDHHVSELHLDQGSIGSLERNGILEGDSLDMLLAFDLGHLLSFFDSDDAFGEFAYESCQLLGQLLSRSVRPTSAVLDSGQIFVDFPEKVGGLALMPCVFDSEFYKCCRRKGFQHLRDISGLSERAIFSMAENSRSAFLAMRGAWGAAGRVNDLLDCLDSATPDVEGSLESLTLRALTEGSAAGRGGQRRLDRDMEIILARLGVQGGAPRTLQSIGDELGLTESRIQQVIKKGMSRLDRKAVWRVLLPLRLFAWSELIDGGGAAPLDDLAERLACDLGWVEVPTGRAVAGALSLLPGFVTDSKRGIARLSDVRCAECQALREELLESLNRPQVVGVESVAKSVSAAHCCSCKGSPLASLSPLLLSEMFQDESFEELGVSLDRALIIRAGRRGTSRRSDSVNANAIEALRRNGKAMHFTEVQQLLARDWQGTSPTPDYVYRILERSPEVVSWDRGSFIHKENISFDYAFIRSVEEWLLSRLTGEDALPLLSVHGACAAFARECRLHNVPSDIALYSLLRVSNDPSLVYPRYPQVYAAAGFSERIPWSIILERYLEAAGDFVSRKQLRHYLVDQIGYRPEQFQILLDGVLNVVFVRGKGFIHADYLHLDQGTLGALDRIARRALRLADEDGHVSIERVFQDCRVDCAVAGVDSASLLYALLRLHQPSDLDLTRYPTVARLRSGEAHKQGVIALVEEHVRKKAAPCSYQELEDRFVKKGGYSEQSVYQVRYRPQVFRYLSASLVHADTIGWDPEMQQTIEEEALRLYSDAVAGGACFSTASQLAEVGTLPKLKSDVVWTAELLADLIGRGDKFLVLGNAHNAYLPIDNNFGISTFADLVAEILERQWRGGANLQEFATCLRAEGVILRNLTSGMLDHSARVAVRGQEIVLLEPSRA